MKSLLHCLCAISLMLALECPRLQSQDALVLFHKMQEALGGADKIASVQAFEQTVRAETWNANGAAGGTVRKRVRWTRPNNLRLDQMGAGDTYVLFFNATTGWEILPDGKVADLSGGELKFAENYLHDFVLNLWLADRNPEYVISSPAPSVLDVAVRGNTSRKIQITIDPKTSLPSGQSAVSLSDPSHPVPSENRFDKWVAVSGVKFPEQTTVYHSGTKRAQITVEQTRINSGIRTEDISVKPADLKPVL